MNKHICKNYDVHFRFDSIFCTTASTRGEAEVLCNKYVTSKVAEISTFFPACLVESNNEYAEASLEPDVITVDVTHMIKYKITGFFAISALNGKVAVEMVNELIKPHITQIEQILGCSVKKENYVVYIDETECNKEEEILGGIECKDIPLKENMPKEDIAEGFKGDICSKELSATQTAEVEKTESDPCSGERTEEKILDMNGNVFIEIEDKDICYNDNAYSIYEVGGCTELNTIAIDGKTLGLERVDVYEGEEVGYVIEALRVEGNKFEAETIWLCVEEMGWSETELITKAEEKLFICNILKECDIELIC